MALATPSPDGVIDIFNDSEDEDYVSKSEESETALDLDDEDGQLNQVVKKSSDSTTPLARKCNKPSNQEMANLMENIENNEDMLR